MSIIHNSWRVFRVFPTVFKRCSSYKSKILTKPYNSHIDYRCLTSATTTSKVLTKDDKREFMAVFPDIVRDLTETNSPEINLLFSKILQYNVSGGKKIRGLTAVFSYRLLAQPEDLTEENIRLSQILGWCIEMLQAFVIMCDDVEDNSETRRGRPCWYKLPEVGLRAISDALLVECGIYNLLKKYVSDKPCYVQLVELFHNATFRTVCGQSLDCNTAMLKHFSSRYTMDRYNTIIRLKTSYYSFHLPVAVAMYQAGIYDLELHRQAKSVLLELGRYFQVQDDYLDVFGESDDTGKIGSDIQDAKCTWLAVVALHKANSTQRALFEDCYGSKDVEKVAAVKKLYEQLGLPALYSAFEEETYNLIFTQIQQLSQGLPHDLFFALLDKIHKRDR